MAIPGFQEFFLPFLKEISDGKEHTMKEINEKLANKYQLTEEELKIFTPSGTQTLFYNRVAWSRTYLKQAGLIEAPRRSVIKITEKGKNLLERKLSNINVKYLKDNYPEFVAFTSAKKEDEKNDAEENTEIENVNSLHTPEEILESSYQQIRSSMVQEIITRIMNQPPNFFEKLVVDLLVKMGYGGSFKESSQVKGQSGDEGIDGTIKEDKLGLDIIYIQAKRWQPGNVVGRPEIQKFVGALAGQGAKKGVFITTSHFTKEAREYSPKNETKIVLIDGNELAQHMIDHNIGVTVLKPYELKKIDNDYFEEE